MTWYRCNLCGVLYALPRKPHPDDRAEHGYPRCPRCCATSQTTQTIRAARLREPKWWR